MKEYVEFRITLEYAHLLFREDEGKNIGDSVKEVRIETNSPVFAKIGEMQKMVKEKYDDLFFTCWFPLRKYTKKDIREARLFQIFPFPFMVAGEECGTKYDESTACPICGAGAKMIPPLKMRRSSIPKKDISWTLGQGEEIIVTERFRKVMEENGITGVRFEPVYCRNKPIEYFQLLPTYYAELSEKTKCGYNPFDFREREEKGFGAKYNEEGILVKMPPAIYKCPNGDNVGLNVLSEGYVKNDSTIGGLDYFASRQTVGYKGVGLLRPHHLQFCSPKMRQVILDNDLKGAVFEVAHIVDE